MNLKKIWQANQFNLLIIWGLTVILLKLGWLLFFSGVTIWLLLLYLTARGIFWTYASFISLSPDTSYERLLKAVSCQPVIDYPYFVLGMITARKEAWPETIPLFEKAVKYASPKKRQQYQIILGEAYRENGDYETALTIFNEALQKGISTAKLYTDLAITHYQMQNYNNALTAAEQARSLNPAATETVLILGKIHFALKDFQAAKADYEWAIEHISYPVESYYWLGRIEYELGNFPSSVNHLETALQRTEEDPLLSSISSTEIEEWLNNAKAKLE